MDFFNTIYGNITIGVISSTVFMILGSFVTVFIKYKLIPWYQNSVYRGIHLEGKWSGEQTSERGVFGFLLELKQIGPNLTGTFYANDEYGGRRRRREHNLNGLIMHNHLILQYSNKKREEYGMGAFLFSIRDGGNELLGSMMFLQTATGNVGASNDLLLSRTS